MFSELFELIGVGLKRILKSRLFVLSILFIVMFTTLVVRLFKLQVLEGEVYQEDYVQTIERTITTNGTRGVIFDRNGKTLAYDKLAYCVSVEDNGVYRNGYEKNVMLMKLIPILDKHNEKIINLLSLDVNANGNVVFTTKNEDEKKRFLRDIYGLKSVDELDDEKGDYPSNVTGEEIFEYLKDFYGVGVLKNKETYEVDNATALKILNIRYAQRLNAFRKYEAVAVSTDVSAETVADILENQSELKEVKIEEKTIRTYNDSFAFAHILGYTGLVSTDELEALQLENDQYAATDLVGKAGIESSMETTLAGTKGKETLYLDSEGRILEATDQVDPIPGNDIYLTIDRDLQVGIYSLLEQNLASVVYNHLTNDPNYKVTDNTDASEIKIPAWSAYFQLINNSLLSMSEMASPDATELQKSIHSRFESKLNLVLPELESHLLTPEAPVFEDCTEEMQDYQNYVYDYMRSQGFFIDGELTADDQIYVDWVNETNNFFTFLHHCIEKNYIDTSKLITDSKYTSTEDTYNTLVNTLIILMREDPEFHKLIYKYLIMDNTISGCEVCLCLFEQGVLADNPDWINRLKTGDRNTCYEFIREKIVNMELTPAQMALDPCSASCVVTDVHTGEVKALVTYPGYDINRFSETIDAGYYRELTEDLSQPFLNRATQVETAPGSIFKVLTTAYGLEEGVIRADELINDTGTYENLGLNLKCWNKAGHGELNVITAIAQSCNFFFSEVGFRISSDSNGQYNALKGIDIIQKYCSQFGLTEKSGVEIAESAPHVTDANPIPSSIGQGTHAYACIHLSRYVTAVASSGNLYKYSLISKVVSPKQETLQEYKTTVENHVELKQSTWNAMHLGMEAVVGEPGTYYSTFKESKIKQEVGFAGKSGTAEQTKRRANHATFMGYAPAATVLGAPYVEPEVAVAVAMPNGYGASNAALIFEQALSVYYGYTSLQSILESNHAADINSTYIPD